MFPYKIRKHQLLTNLQKQKREKAQLLLNQLKGGTEVGIYHLFEFENFVKNQIKESTCTLSIYNKIFQSKFLAKIINLLYFFQTKKYINSCFLR